MLRTIMVCVLIGGAATGCASLGSGSTAYRLTGGGGACSPWEGGGDCQPFPISADNTIGAEQFTTTPGPYITYQDVIIFPGQEFTLAVPKDAAAAVFHYHFKGGDVTLSPGDSDNNMVLVNHFTRGNFNIYNYNMTKVR
jgi:hypothetical protein